MLLTLLGTVALADDCPWTEIEDVSSTMTKVSINGEMRSVVGMANWSRLARDLRDCDANQAAANLERWRQKRRATNTTLAVGTFFLWPLWIGSAFHASAAGRWRMAMEDELRDWEPES